MSTRDLKKKQITSQREEQILQAALEVFSQKGYAAATVPEIARLAGVATGTIYIYFPSKREMFIAVIRKFILTVPLLNLIENMPKAEFPAIFKSILQNRLNLTEGDKMSRISSLMGEIQRDPELKALFSEKLIQPFLSRMEDYYRDASVTNNFRQLEPTVAVRALGGMILGFIMLKSMEGSNSPIIGLPQEKVAQDLLNFVLFGLIDDRDKSKHIQENVA
jgi:AcrR family transcriptional regulator